MLLKTDNKKYLEIKICSVQLSENVAKNASVHVISDFGLGVETAFHLELFDTAVGCLGRYACDLSNFQFV